MQKIYHVGLSFSEVLAAFESERFAEQQENGYRGVHFEPALLDFLHAEPLFYGRVRFFQNGNYYPPGTSHMSEFSVSDFFDDDKLHNSGAMSEELGEVRADARKDWAKSNEVALAKVEENYLDENWKHYEAVNAAMDEWEQNAISFFREQATAYRLDEVIDIVNEGQDNEIMYIYKIQWMEA